jgi:hypothetical protein
MKRTPKWKYLVVAKGKGPSKGGGQKSVMLLGHH